MSITKIVEEIAGAVAAEKALEAVDPKAGLLTKAAAAVLGAEAAKLIEEKVEETLHHGDTPQPEGDQPA